MMRRSDNRRSWRLPLIILVSIALGAPLLGWLLRQQSGHAAAQARWQSQAVGHYLLTTEETVQGRPCFQQVEVRNGDIKRIVSDTCPHPTLWTVEWLFRYASNVSTPRANCARLVIGVGCVCRDGVVWSAEYEPNRGFPTLISSYQQWSANWMSGDYWRYALREREIPDCSMPYEDLGRTIRVISLESLQ